MTAHSPSARGRPLKIAGLVLAGVIVLLVLLLAFFPWNVLRPWIGRTVTEHTGRAFAIDGDLRVHPFSLSPRVTAERLRFANAPWGREPQMLDLRMLDFRVRLLDLLRGEVVLPEVTLTQPQVVLEKSADGRRNWSLNKEQRGGRLPTIGRLTVDRGTLRFRDPGIKTDLAVQLETASRNGQRGLAFDADGRYQGLTATGQGWGGPVLALADASLPYPIAGDVKIGSTSARIEGQLTGLATLAGVDIKLDLRGDDAAELYKILHLALPETPPYHLTGRLVRESQTWKLQGFAGKVGDSDLAGDLSVDLGRAPKFLRATLTSRLLDVNDLAGFVGTTPGVGAGETASARQRREAAAQQARPRVLPEREFNAEKLQSMDADVQFQGQRIRRKTLPLDDLKAHLRLDKGVLRLDPLNFGVAGGHLLSTITVDGSAKPMKLKADVTVRQLHLNQLFPKMKLTKASAGLIGGSAQLSGQGNSLGQQLGSADGRLGLAMAGGRISHLLVEIAHLNLGEVLALLLGGDENVPIRCAVMDFSVKNGTMKSNTLVFDTQDTKVLGSGVIDLRHETLDLQLRPLPKHKGILSLRSPLRVTGSFKKPEFSPEKGVIAAKGAGALALGALAGPLAALLPLIETGPGKSSDCGALLENEAASGGAR